MVKNMNEPSEKKEISEYALQKAVSAWCKPTTSHKIMDVELAQSFAEIIEEQSKEIEQLRTQMAGILVAAEGGTSEEVRANAGDYGWSLAYQTVLDLRLDYEQYLNIWSDGRMLAYRVFSENSSCFSHSSSTRK
jgi:hypothetical protein